MALAWNSCAPFSSQSSQNHKSQTVRDRKLTFWENVHPPPCVICHVSHVMYQVSGVMCQVSGVTCHVSCVTCNVSRVTCQMSFFWQNGGACRGRVCYQWGLPRLFKKKKKLWHLTLDTWHLTPDTWYVTHETWNVTRDTWLVTRDTWWEVNILSKFQLPGSYGLGVLMFWRFEGKGRISQSIN